MNGNIFRLNQYFLNKIQPGIHACLGKSDPISSTILICCAIDFLAKFYSGQANSNDKKKKYLAFLKEYFPTYPDQVMFYSFVRSGLVHGYDMEGKYILINSKSDWALDLHMKYDVKHKAYIINPYILYKDLKNAFNAYIVNLKQDKGLQKRLDIVYGKYPFRKQLLKTPKFKYIHKERLFK